MKFRNYLYSLFLILVSCTYFSFNGCSSAESTTGKLAFQNKDYVKAEAELKKGLQVDKNDDEGWYMLGVSQVELGKYEEAGESFKRSLAISKNYADEIQAYWIEKFNAGATAFQQGINSESKKDSINAMKNFERALNFFMASTYIIPDSLKSLKAVGESYMALNQTDKAMEVFNVILSKSKSKDDAERVARVLYDVGMNLFQMKNYTSAAETFKKIVDMEYLPKNSVYYETSAYNYALAKAKMGEMEREANSKSENYKTHFRDALVYLEPLSVSLNTKTLEIQIWDLLVAVYANLGETKKAEDALLKKQSLEKK